METALSEAKGITAHSCQGTFCSSLLHNAASPRDGMAPARNGSSTSGMINAVLPDLDGNRRLANRFLVAEFSHPDMKAAEPEYAVHEMKRGMKSDVACPGSSQTVTGAARSIQRKACLFSAQLNIMRKTPILTLRNPLLLRKKINLSIVFFFPEQLREFGRGRWSDLKT